jgi:gliding motility-associated-like protein
MPNFVQSYFNIPAVTYDTKCFGDQTIFTITNPANTDSWTWDFGDATSGAGNSPIHQYASSGDYSVTLTETFNGRSFTSTFPVTIHPLPPKSFTQDSLYIFPGSSIPLDGGADMMTYMWQNGYSGRFLNVSEPDSIFVFIVDTNCCQMSDTLRVILLDLAVPTAFTPNGDLLNDLFRVKGPTEGIDNYQFSVFNQWGQMIWETSDFLAGWDGKVKGTLCTTGLYTWLMKFSVKGNIMNGGNVVKRGSFMLLR